MERPLGVTLLGILTILLGLLILFVGLLFLAIGFLGPSSFPWLPRDVIGISLVSGLVVTVIGIIWIASGIGLLRLRFWAWVLAILAMVVTLVLLALSLPASWCGTLVAGLILVYLIAVRRHFD